MLFIRRNNSTFLKELRREKNKFRDWKNFSFSRDKNIRVLLLTKLQRCVTRIQEIG